MSLCVNTPRLPQGPTYAGETLGKGHRRFALPAHRPERVEGTGELQREPHPDGVESEHARGASKDGGLAIACGGFQVPGCTAFLAWRFDGPPWRVTGHHLWRR